MSSPPWLWADRDRSPCPIGVVGAPPGTAGLRAGATDAGKLGCIGGRRNDVGLAGHVHLLGEPMQTLCQFHRQAKKSPAEPGFLESSEDHLSKASTVWGCWLACANMAVAACWMIWVRASSAVVAA